MTDRTIKHTAFVTMAQFYAVAVLVCIVVWAAVGTDYFWPKWVILGAVLKVGIAARVLYGRSGSR